MFRKVEQHRSATTTPEPGQRSEVAEQRTGGMGIRNVFVAKGRGVTVPPVPPPVGLRGVPGYQVGENGVFDATLN